MIVVTFLSAIEKTGPLIRVSINCMGSIGQENLVSSIIVFNWRASRAVLSDSPFLMTMTGILKVFSVVTESVFTGAKNSNCVKISGKCCTVSCNCRGIREARCFLNTVVALKSKFNSTLIFLTPNLDMA